MALDEKEIIRKINEGKFIPGGEKMTTVEDYLKEQRKAMNAVATTERRIRQAYDAAQAGIQEGNYDHLDRLVDNAVRTQFKRTFIDHLVHDYQAGISALPEDEPFARAVIMNGFFGFTPEESDGFIDYAQENISFDAFMKFLHQQTRVSEAKKTKMRAPGGVLSKVPTDEVLKYVGVKVARPDLVTLQDKAEMIAQFEEHGVVTPNYLKSKPFR